MQLPYSLNKLKLAGRGITPIHEMNEPEQYLDQLYEVVELDMHLEAEEGMEKEIKTSMKEQLIYVIAGSLSLTPPDGEKQTFYAGDFFVLPTGFIGKWESKGHHLFRSLRVIKAQ